MTNLIVMPFPTEVQAVEASHKLQELENYGDISIYEKALIKRNEFGDTSVIDSDTTDGIRTVSGMALGTLVGALGGPVGMLIGLVTGTLTGAAMDVDHEDFDDEFVNKVSNRLEPGTSAIIAEISEDDPALLDDVFASYDTTILRSDVDYEYENYEDDEMDDLDDEIAEQRAKLKSAASSEKSKIQEKISELKERRSQRIATLKENHRTGKSKFRMKVREHKVSRLKARIARHQKKIAQLEAELKKLEAEKTV